MPDDDTTERNEPEEESVSAVKRSQDIIEHLAAAATSGQVEKDNDASGVNESDRPPDESVEGAPSGEAGGVGTGEPMRQFVQPQPIPEIWYADPFVYPNGEVGLLITISGPTGLQQHFMPRGYTLTFIETMRKTLREASRKIQTATPEQARASGIILP